MGGDVFEFCVHTHKIFSASCSERDLGLVPLVRQGRTAAGPVQGYVSARVGVEWAGVTGVCCVKNWCYWGTVVSLKLCTTILAAVLAPHITFSPSPLSPY